MRILVVDRNRDAANTLALLLRRWGYAAEVAYDGSQALAQARHFRPSVVLSELILSGLDGFRLAAELRAELGGVVLIALTGMSREQDVRRASEAGYASFVIKPADPAAIRELLQLMEEA